MNQKGFSHIIALALIATLLVLGFAGWYVWSKNQKDNKQSGQPQTTVSEQDTEQKPDQKKQADPYEGWLTYANSTYGISFRYPADWKVKESQSEDGEGSISINRSEEVKYNTAAVIEIRNRSLNDAVTENDRYFGQSSSNKIHKTEAPLKGRQSVQYLVTHTDDETRLYLFSVDSQVYSFGSINEWFNTHNDADYWTKFTKVFDSFQITK